MEFKLDFVKTVLDFDFLTREEFNRFLLDYPIVFKNNNFDFFKLMNQFAKGKRKFSNKNYNNFIEEYKNLLIKLIDKNVLNDFVNLLLTSQANKKLLEFANYINCNIQYIDQMLKCVEGLEKSKISTISLVPNLDFSLNCMESRDGNYHQITGAYSDGNCVILDEIQIGYTTSYTVKFENANYIISYTKDNIDGLKKMNVYVSNLQFDPATLPHYNKLHGTNCWQVLNLESNKMYKKI